MTKLIARVMISDGLHWVIVFTLQKQLKFLFFCTYLYLYKTIGTWGITLWSMMHDEARCRHGRFEDYGLERDD